MSKFVNYNKRSVNLPPGCKDLIDLLQSQRRSKAHNIIPDDEELALTRYESGIFKLAEIEKFVAMPFTFRAPAFILELRLPDGRVGFDLAQAQGQLASASAMFEDDSERERLIREFFTTRGFQLPQSDYSGVHFMPGVPVQVFYRISPVPPDISTASKLAAEFFRRVGGLGDDSELNFCYYELYPPLTPPPEPPKS